MAISIKKSFASCESCALLPCQSCIAETNSASDLSKVEVVFVAENPGSKEIELQTPLIGPAGRVFRHYFDLYFVNYFRYLLTNTVLCQTLKPDGTTGNPSWYVIENCRANCFHIIRQCSPALIVVMGASAMRAFDIARTGITSMRGQLYEWEGYKVLLTVHPSYVLRTGEYEEFGKDLKKARDILAAELMHVQPATVQGQAWKTLLKQFTVELE